MTSQWVIRFLEDLKLFLLEIISCHWLSKHFSFYLQKFINFTVPMLKLQKHFRQKTSKYGKHRQNAKRWYSFMVCSYQAEIKFQIGLTCRCGMVLDQHGTIFFLYSLCTYMKVYMICIKITRHDGWFNFNL